MRFSLKSAYFDLNYNARSAILCYAFSGRHEKTFFKSTWVFTHFDSEGAVIKHSYAFAFCFFFLLIKGTKTGDSDAADIVECLTDGDYVTLKLRARTGNGDERKAWQKNKMKTHMKVVPPKIRKPCPYSTAQ